MNFYFLNSQLVAISNIVFVWWLHFSHPMGVCFEQLSIVFEICYSLFIYRNKIYDLVKQKLRIKLFSCNGCFPINLFRHNIEWDVWSNNHFFSMKKSFYRSLSNILRVFHDRKIEEKLFSLINCENLILHFVLFSHYAVPSLSTLPYVL